MTDGFEKTFEKLTHTQDPTRIFDEFLDYCIDINLFQLEKQELDFKGREEQYMTMFQEWIFLTNEKLSQEDTIGWYDYLGELMIVAVVVQGFYWLDINMILKLFALVRIWIVLVLRWQL